ncbi:hypothetical protein I8748_23240 [Nostoc sp. CENA67]|uniref:Uncharacterized protein n=1 Tax=Amazonocrinis nigriterrae CENA67 TaxID=2794033 RepID=A0A8J7HS21_9NOST|nr:hypothetical protein [Amazonocrinis nigriterrae]MBH8565063.1 hypothetical protein [Amazonocrinis nigriterrae CENA67]
MELNQGCIAVNSLQSGQFEDQTILVSANPTNSSPMAGESIIPVLMQGGVAVAVILAMSYFCNILLKSMAQLIKDANQKHK